jgi:hypothetical protein
MENVDAVVELTYGDPWRLLKTAQNVEFLQLRGIEDKPGLQVHLQAIIECLFGHASSFFSLLKISVWGASMVRLVMIFSQEACSFCERLLP